MKKPVKVKPELPPGVLPIDLSLPDYKKDPAVSDVGAYGALTFYKTENLGWCLMTLGISRGRRGTADRSYGIRLDTESVVRLGNGPHVTQQVTIYVRKSRAGALKKFTDLYTQGMARAGGIRDRISSRRAQGQEERAAGNRYWRWNS